MGRRLYVESLWPSWVRIGRRRRGTTDSGRAARAREEIEAISDQLNAAVGLGGRDRAVAAQPNALTRVKTRTFGVQWLDPTLPIAWDLA